MFRDVEAPIQSKVTARARLRGWNVHRLDPRANLGVPDHIFVRMIEDRIRVIYVEFKRPAKEPEAHQERKHNKLRAQGFEVYVVDDVELGYALFD
jgi:hypothetical protein